MAHWLAVDSRPLSRAVVQVLEMLDGGATWTIIDSRLDLPREAELPDFCLSLTENDNLVLELLHRNVRTYCLQSGSLPVFWLLDRDVEASATFDHLTPRVARRVLHKWKNRSMPDVPLQVIVSDILLPLEALGYLKRGDSRHLQKYADLEPQPKPDVIVREIEGRVFSRLERYLS